MGVVAVSFVPARHKCADARRHIGTEPQRWLECDARVCRWAGAHATNGAGAQVGGNAQAPRHKPARSYRNNTT